MSASMSIRGALSRTKTVVFDLMHGGLVMAGTMLTLACAAFVASHPSADDALRSLREVATSVAPAPNSSAEDSGPGPATPSPKLGAEMRVVLEHVSRRYRVSATALEPAFVAAQTSGRQLSLDPLLIIAVAAVESGFNPLAESVMGARGLMQVIPRFHRDKLPADDDGRALFDPATNVGIGAAILKESIRRMGGLTVGLQQFAGALDDPDQTYAARVLAEKQRLETAARRGRGNAS